MLSRAEQRRSHRVPIEVPVEFTSRDSWEKVPGVSEDISLGGMFIETAFPAAFGVAVSSASLFQVTASRCWCPASCAGRAPAGWVCSLRLSGRARHTPSPSSNGSAARRPRTQGKPLIGIEAGQQSRVDGDRRSEHERGAMRRSSSVPSSSARDQAGMSVSTYTAHPSRFESFVSRPSRPARKWTRRARTTAPSTTCDERGESPRTAPRQVHEVGRHARRVGELAVCGTGATSARAELHRRPLGRPKARRSRARVAARPPRPCRPRSPR